LALFIAAASICPGQHSIYTEDPAPDLSDPRSTQFKPYPASKLKDRFETGKEMPTDDTLGYDVFISEPIRRM
jgi:hypothetical protein